MNESLEAFVRAIGNLGALAFNLLFVAVYVHFWGWAGYGKFSFWCFQIVTFLAFTINLFLSVWARKRKPRIETRNDF